MEQCFLNYMDVVWDLRAEGHLFINTEAAKYWFCKQILKLNNMLTEYYQPKWY